MNYSLRLLGLASILVACGCSAMGGSDMSSAPAMGAPGGEFGATQGGVQDMTFARKLVEEGRIPPADAFIVEAMFSEHDLPIEGAPCAKTLCLRAAMGVAPNNAGNPAAWTQIGMSSTIDPATYQAPSMAIVATVDVSGSMGWGYGEGQTTPASITHALLRAIAGQLREGDRFSLVSYGSSSWVNLGWTHGTDPAIAASIDSLGEAGSTNMEAGMKLAYSKAAEALGTAQQTRVLLFTDVQPNVGATTATEFQQLAGDGASKGVGLTVFGVGLGMGAEVMKAMSELRGGNAFSVMNPADVPSFMEDNWPWLASPVAYGLKLQASAAPGLTLAGAYGFPGEQSTSLEVATVFLSKRRGGMLLELAPSGPLETGSVEVSLQYSDSTGENHQETLTASYDGQALDEQGRYLPQQGLRRAVPLAKLVTAMHDAATVYRTQPDTAISVLQTALQRFELEAAGDAELEKEAQFWNKLLGLMKSGAPQGDLYPH